MTLAPDDRVSDRSTVPDLPGDDVLLEAARSGDPGAFRMLRERYLGTALAVARVHTGTVEEAEEITFSAFEKIERIVSEGGGPHSFLGAFVVWMVGREARGGTGPVALPEDPSDPSALVRAFTRLPADWQAFLWHTEIQRWPVRRAAAVRGISAVAAVPMQRDVFVGLRRAYRQMGAPAEMSAGCEQCCGDLIGFVRGDLPLHRRQEVQQHLAGCTGCTAEYLRKQDPGTGLRTWALPVLAGLAPWGAQAAGVAGMLEESGISSGEDQESRTSPWSGRGTRALLGAGALVTAVAVASAGLSSVGDPARGPDPVAAEQAPGPADDAGAAGTGAIPGADPVDGASGDERSSAERISRGSGGGTTNPAPDGAVEVPNNIGGVSGDGSAKTSSGAPRAERGAGQHTAGGDGTSAGPTPVHVAADGSLDAVGVDRTDWGAERPATVAPAPPTKTPGPAPDRSAEMASGTSRSGVTERPSVRESASAPPLSPTREEGLPTPLPSALGSWPVVLLDPAPRQAPTPAARASYPPSIPVTARETSGAEGQWWEASTSRTSQAERDGRAEQRRGGGWHRGLGEAPHHERGDTADHAGDVDRIDRWGDGRPDGENRWGDSRSDRENRWGQQGR